MGLVHRLERLIWGDSLDPALRPLIAQGLAGSIAGSAGWSFLGIWALKRLHAGQTALGLAFLAGALLGAAAGYAGGHVSDHLGRRPVMLIGEGGFVALTLAFLLVGGHKLPGLVLMALAPTLGSLGSSSAQALVADLVPSERHEAGFASTRVAGNLGATLGPVIGGALLFIGSWTALFVGIAALGAVAFLIALKLIPVRGRYTPERAPERGSFGVIRRDRAFLLFLLSGAFAYLVYVAYETVLPISLVGSHGYAASTWGFLVVVNPLSVTLLQLRLTRAAARVPAQVKLAGAMLLMGLPFLLLNVSASIPVVLLVIFVFVVGEMLWVPTSQTAVAALAPADIRGAYMGAFGATSSFGFALAPLFGLQIRAGFGDGAMWLGFAAMSVVAAATGWAALRGRQFEPLPPPVVESALDG